jgi:hypothetical protein
MPIRRLESNVKTLTAELEQIGASEQDPFSLPGGSCGSIALCGPVGLLRRNVELKARDLSPAKSLFAAIAASSHPLYKQRYQRTKRRP